MREPGNKSRSGRGSRGGARRGAGHERGPEPRQQRQRCGRGAVRRGQRDALDEQRVARHAAKEEKSDSATRGEINTRNKKWLTARNVFLVFLHPYVSQSVAGLLEPVWSNRSGEHADARARGFIRPCYISPVSAPSSAFPVISLNWSGCAGRAWRRGSEFQ